ncbi:hypothetical protein B0H19DRAFT_1341231 [Mycena capillaripes]|nr:hypothetical protein B0H19DRAFT_1341231 [Mycena capillaripes]
MTPDAAVPPTTHTVPRHQRIRLMRSTRKLTALLGTTPLLLDPRSESEPPRTADSESPLEPIDSQASPATIASIISYASENPDAAEERPAALVPAMTPASGRRPTLLLRINTVPPRSSRRRSNSQGWGRPASLAIDRPLPSPVFSSDSAGPSAADAVLAARRKKMARVARTLGENVPPELVFPRAPCSPATHARNSLDSLFESEDEEEKVQLSSLEEVRFANVVLRPVEGAPFASAAAPSAFRAGSDSETAKRPSMSSDRVWLPYSTRRSMSLQRRNSHGRAPVVMRTEPGWTGEWNQEERTVIKGLRELKEE